MSVDLVRKVAEGVLSFPFAHLYALDTSARSRQLNLRGRLAKSWRT